MPAETDYRPLESFREFRECVEIQRDTWGEDSPDHVPASLMSVAVKVGGIAAGAFVEGEDRMAGFVFGLAGWRDDRRVHWSHMLAVRRSYRDRGMGRRLKELQRELLLEDGVDTVYWTFDPLIAKNAHLNLNLLATRVDEFVTDMYGAGLDSPLHVGGATDRFVVRWDLESPRVVRALKSDREPSPEGAEEAPVVDPRAVPEPADYPEAQLLRLTIPARAVALDAEDPDLGLSWREGLRTALLHYLSRGYRVEGFLPEKEADVGYYLLQRQGRQA